MIEFACGITKEDLEKAAIDDLGTTDDIRSAGFILRDGTLIDLKRREDTAFLPRDPDSTARGFITHHRAVERIDVQIAWDLDVACVGLNVATFLLKTGAVRLVMGVTQYPSAEVACSDEFQTPITHAQVSAILDAFKAGIEDAEYTRKSMSIRTGILPKKEPPHLYMDFIIPTKGLVLEDIESKADVVGKYISYESSTPSVKEIIRAANNACRLQRCTCIEGGLCCGV